MRKQKYYIYLSGLETSALLKSLIKFRNTVTHQGRYPDIIDDIIKKIIYAPIQRI